MLTVRQTIWQERSTDYGEIHSRLCTRWECTIGIGTKAATMSASLSPTRIFKCDGCHAVLPYDPTRAGQKCRCGQCGKILIVPVAHEVEAPPSTPPASPPYIEFWCHVCDTRLVAHAADAGRKAKCFDCGAINRVPRPKPVVKPHEPAALHGQRYGIWEVHKAPAPDQLPAGRHPLELGRAGASHGGGGLRWAALKDCSPPFPPRRGRIPPLSRTAWNMPRTNTQRPRAQSR